MSTVTAMLAGPEQGRRGAHLSRPSNAVESGPRLPKALDPYTDRIFAGSNPVGKLWD